MADIIDFFEHKEKQEVLKYKEEDKKQGNWQRLISEYRLFPTFPEVFGGQILVKDYSKGEPTFSIPTTDDILDLVKKPDAYKNIWFIHLSNLDYICMNYIPRQPNDFA